MGNMPNKWVGRGIALAAAIAAAVGGYFLGDFVGTKLASGFTFDWYVHDTESRYDVGHVLTVVSLMTGGAALLGLAIASAPAGVLTRKWAARIGYTPPRYKDAHTLDVHSARLGLLLGQTGVLAALLLYVYFSFPFEWAGNGFTRLPAYGEISPSGFALLMAIGAAFGAFVGVGLTVASVYAGIVDGKIASSGINLLARISLWGMRNAKTTVAIVVGVTLVAGFYASSVSTNVDVADVLPRGDPNTDAAHNLTSKFKSSFTQAVTWQFRVIDTNNTTQMELYERENAEKLPNRIDSEFTPRDPSNITDELYVRAISEVIAFVTSQEPFVGSVGSPDFYKLINWTRGGGQNESLQAIFGGGDASFALPPTDEQGERDYVLTAQLVQGVGPVYSALDAVTSPSWRQTAVLVTVSPNSDVDSRYIGERAFELRDQWVEKVRKDQTEFAIFGPENPPMFTYDLPLANAHASELTKHDFTLLLPIIALFIAVTLFIAFRSVASVLVTFSSLAIAVIWTFGAMGAMKIPLNTINLAVVPLIMGVGIDYAIHMMNEYQEFRAKGKTPEEAWIETGSGSAFALFVGALTTIAGLAVMVISPSLLVAQLGFLGIVALISCYTLSVLFIPAATALLGDRRRVKHAQYTPSRLMPGLATAVSRTRILVVVVVLLLAGAAVASKANLRREAFGDPPRNWMEDDEHRLEHEEALQGFYETSDVKANILIIEGDLTDPNVHAYINNLTATLRANAVNGTYSGIVDNVTVTGQSRIEADTLRDLPFLVRTYLSVRGGAPGAAGYIGGTQGVAPLAERFAQAGLPVPGAVVTTADPYPKTRGELRAMLDEVFESPLYQFGNLFLNSPDYDMTVIVFSVTAATYDDAESVWNEVQAAIAANDALKPEGTTTSYFGNTAINYLFVAKQVPWLNAMNTVTIILIVGIVFLFTRKILPTIAVGVVSFLTSTLWFGLLPTEYVDIGLAINLTLPLIFISAMGSDYALHLSMRCQKSGDTRDTFESVGKGVLFSFITTLGAFLVFTQISDYSGRRSIIGTVLAIGCVFFVTMVTVPLLFPVKKGQHGHSGHAVPVVDSRRNAEPQRIEASPPPVIVPPPPTTTLTPSGPAPREAPRQP